MPEWVLNRDYVNHNVVHFLKSFEVLQKLLQKLKWGRETMQMKEKDRALTLVKKIEFVIAVAIDIGVLEEAIYQLQRLVQGFSTGGSEWCFQ